MHIYAFKNFGTVACSRQIEREAIRNIKAAKSQQSLFQAISVDISWHKDRTE